VAAAVLAPAEGAVAELALVLLLRLAGLACSSSWRGVGGHRSRHDGRMVGGRQALNTLHGGLTRMPGARGRGR
jgi:hypothetical protein